MSDSPAPLAGIDLRSLARRLFEAPSRPKVLIVNPIQVFWSAKTARHLLGPLTSANWRRHSATAEIEKSGIGAAPSRNLTRDAGTAAGIRHGIDFERPGNRGCRRKRRIVCNASGCECSAE